jgi:hypothetical protein
MLHKPKLRVQKQIFALLILVTIAILIRGIFLTRWCGDFNSDEAIVGLMAKHTLEGHFPVFFYGQFYMGSLEAMGAAAIFWFFGDMNGLLLRLSAVVFYLAFVIVSFFWLDTWHNHLTAMWGTLFLAIPPALLMIYTYVASAGNIEMVLLGTLLFLLYQRGLTLGWNSRRVFGVGLVAGLTLWTHLLAMLYLVTILVIWILSSSWWPKWRTSLLKLSPLAWLIIISFSVLGVALVALFGLKPAMDVLYIQRLLIGTVLVGWIASITFLRWRNRLNPPKNSQSHAELYAFWLGLGGILGMAPMIFYFFNPGRSTGGADNFSFVTWQRLPEVWRLNLFEIFPALIGLRTYTDSASVVMFLIKIGVAAIFVGVILLFYKLYKQALLDIIFLRPMTPQPEHYLWLLGGFTIAFGFVNGNNYAVEHIRYFLPLLFVLSAMVGIAFAQWQRAKPVLAIALAIFLWGYYGVTHLQYYQALPATCSAQQVVDFLINNHIPGGQAYYQNAYKLTFLSHEKVIIAPYRSRDRYEAYTHYVTTLPQQTYILQEGPETELFLSELESPTDFVRETVDNFNIFTSANTP